jgi:hypothetical protein
MLPQPQQPRTSEDARPWSATSLRPPGHEHTSPPLRRRRPQLVRSRPSEPPPGTPGALARVRCHRPGAEVAEAELRLRDPDRPHRRPHRPGSEPPSTRRMPLVRRDLCRHHAARQPTDALVCCPAQIASMTRRSSRACRGCPWTATPEHAGNPAVGLGRDRWDRGVPLVGGTAAFSTACGLDIRPRWAVGQHRPALDAPRRAGRSGPAHRGPGEI